jgi:hypothetical protein
VFNTAMLARQVWRILTHPDTLCAQVLKAKYFPIGTILDAKPKKDISYSWRSILRGVDLIKEGMIWHIGDGNSINIWSDPWLPRGETRRPRTPRNGSVLTKVVDLINPITNTWYPQLIRETFCDEDVQLILAIRLRENQRDLLHGMQTQEAFSLSRRHMQLGFVCVIKLTIGINPHQPEETYQQFGAKFGAYR